MLLNRVVSREVYFVVMAGGGLPKGVRQNCSDLDALAAWMAYPCQAVSSCCLMDAGWNINDPAVHQGAGHIHYEYVQTDR